MPFPLKTQAEFMGFRHANLYCQSIPPSAEEPRSSCPGCLFQPNTPKEPFADSVRLGSALGRLQDLNGYADGDTREGCAIFAIADANQETSHLAIPRGFSQLLCDPNVGVWELQGINRYCRKCELVQEFGGFKTPRPSRCA